MAGRLFGLKVSRGHDGRRPALPQQVGFFRLIDQRDMARFGIAQRGGAKDQQLAVTDDLTADQRGKLGKGGLHVAESFPGRVAPSCPPNRRSQTQGATECTAIARAGQ